MFSLSLSPTPFPKGFYIKIDQDLFIAYSALFIFHNNSAIFFSTLRRPSNCCILKQMPKQTGHTRNMYEGQACYLPVRLI